MSAFNPFKAGIYISRHILTSNVNTRTEKVHYL